MNNDEVCEKFKKSINYKTIGFIIMLFTPMPLVVFDGLLKYILTGIIFAIAVYFLRQYKCPSCGFVFDYREESHRLVYCSKCGRKLQ